MKIRHALCLLALLAACKEDSQQSTAPVPMTAEATGHFCQMNLLEHDGPKAQVHLEGLPGMPLFFSQVRDAIAYARLPEQSAPILAIWVSDMGAPGASWAEPGIDNWIDAETAHYVVGSARTGGMGAPELVPFSREGDAGAFAAAHGGQVMRLKAIPDSAVIAPVAAPDDTDTDFERRLKALSQQQAGG